MKVFFGTVSNNDFILKMILRCSALKDQIIYQSNAPTATQGWNELLDGAEGNDIAVLCHHDIYFPEGWLDKLTSKISELQDDWIIAGFFGLNEEGKECGKIHDRRIPIPMKTEHELPTKAITVDGCAFVVNLKKGFRFEEMPGFDLYDVYMCLRAKEMNGSTWIIDCMPEHYATRPWSWKPDAVFMRNWNWLKERFPNDKIISTCYRD